MEYVYLSCRLGAPPPTGKGLNQLSETPHGVQFGRGKENSSEEDIPRVKLSGDIVWDQEEMFSLPLWGWEGNMLTEAPLSPGQLKLPIQKRKQAVSNLNLYQAILGGTTVGGYGRD